MKPKLVLALVLEDTTDPFGQLLLDLQQAGSLEAWPLVFDRYPVTLLQEFHDHILAHAMLLDQKGHKRLFLGALQTHDVVCKYINAKLGIKEDEAEAKSNAHLN